MDNPHSCGPSHPECVCQKCRCGCRCGESTGAPRLFVDCDDTLILWHTSRKPPHDGQYCGTWYSINKALVAGVKEFRLAHPRSLVVVWSGGGQTYAAMWADLLGLSADVICLTKDRDTLHLVLPGDIMVDDVSEIPGVTHGPFAWPEESIPDTPFAGMARVDEFWQPKVTEEDKGE